MRVFSQCAAFFHGARFLFQSLLMAFDHGFVFPTLDLFDGGFFA